MPAVPRPRRNSQGPADLEPRARLAHGPRAPAVRLDPGLDEEAIRHPAGHAHAGVLAGLSEVVLPAAGWRCGEADSGDQKLPDDIQRRPESEDAAGRAERE